MKHSWVMYAALIILAVVILKNAAGATTFMLGTASAGTGLITALEGPSVTSQSGTFSFGNSRTATLK